MPCSLETSLLSRNHSECYSDGDADALRNSGCRETGLVDAQVGEDLEVLLSLLLLGMTSGQHPCQSCSCPWLQYANGGVCVFLFSVVSILLQTMDFLC